MILGICGLAGSGKDTAAKFVIDDHRFIPMAFADEMKRICKRVYGFTDDQLWGPSASRNAVDKRYPRSHHTWTKLPKREAGESLHDGRLITWYEDRWEGCACCGVEALFVEVEPGGPVRAPEGLGPCFLTPRYALQQLGTGWGRDCYWNTWVDVTIRDARLLLGWDREVAGGYWYDRAFGLQSNILTNRIPDYIPGVVVTDCRYLNEIQAIKTAGGKVVRVVRPGAGLQGGAALHSSETEQATIPDEAFDAVIVNDESLEALQSRVHHTTVTLLGVKR
jgi:hypothetical protein